jgi:hypothetical protein
METNLNLADTPNAVALTKDDFFHIELKLLEGKAIFPFHVYVYHPVSKTYTPFLWGNDPLIANKRRLLEMVYKVGGGIAIKITQKLTFLSSMDLREEDVPSLCPKDIDPLLLEQRRKKEQLQKEKLEDGIKSHKVRARKGISNSLESDNFTSLIALVAGEIGAFPVTLSPTVSLARELAGQLMTEDNWINRVVALSYLLAKEMNLGEIESLSDLVCAGYFHHLGMTQIEYGLLHRPQARYSDEEQKLYRHHPGLCQHLMKKSGVEISERVFLIINEHHERHDGRGYPQAKKGNNLDPLSLVLGSISHLMEFSYGMVDGNKISLKSLIQRLSDSSPIPGLEMEFGPALLDGLVSMFKYQDESNNDKITSEAA